jgi:hypothetical protein
VGNSKEGVIWREGNAADLPPEVHPLQNHSPWQVYEQRVPVAVHANKKAAIAAYCYSSNVLPVLKG